MNSYPPPPPPARTSNERGKSMESRPYRKDFGLDHPRGPSDSCLEREELTRIPLEIQAITAKIIY